MRRSGVRRIGLIAVLVSLALLIGGELAQTVATRTAAPPVPTAATAPATVANRGATTASLTWPAVPGATGYAIEYDTTAGFTTPRRVTSAAAEDVLSELTPETDYFVRVATWDAASGTQGAWGPTVTFTTREPEYHLDPPTVTLSAASTTSITAKWTQVTPHAEYQAKMGSDPDDLGPVKEATGRSVTYDKLDRKTKYYVSVRAVDPSGDAVTAWSNPVAVTTPDSLPLRVGSYNILCANCSKGKAPWSKRREALVETIRSQDLDVLGVQEASIGGIGGHTTQYQDLINRLGKPYRLTEVRRGVSPDIRIIYNADRLKLVKQGIVALPRGSSRRFMDWAIFVQKSTGSQFLFTNTHLDPRNSKAGRATDRAQAKAIVAAIAKLKGGRPVISVGDYASTKWEKGGNDPYDVMQAAGYKDPLGNAYHSRGSAPGAFVEKRIHTSYASLNMYKRKARNFPGWVNGSNTDYIFVSRMRVSEYEVVVKIDSAGRFIGVIPSDHNLIRATVYLP